MTTGIGGPRPPPAPLTQARNAQLSLAELAPWIEQYAEQYGVSAELVAAVIEQESSYVNHAVHRDGTGHGLVGLDDNGLLPDFERWSGLRVGRGRAAATIPPEKQIEFLAKTLGAMSQRYGDEWEAVRAWHAGHGGRNRASGAGYETLIRARVANVAAAVAPTSGAEPPDEATASASRFEDRRPRPLDLGERPAGAPLAASLDYEKIS